MGSLPSQWTQFCGPTPPAGLTALSNQANGCVSSRRSWQSVTFERQPASFIRIVGTHNTANEVFHCVHFECPEQQSSPKEESSEESGPGATSPASQLSPHALRALSGRSLPSSPASNSRSPSRQHQ
ncbi:PREDICTED: BTB/POZ domain-containing protein 9 [Galeopterus variegatus]|uniref:BTB/POZ domain-containing protein 9 n=1 Tax=Galeopterus variegatus TaxID=482537 RepID=A0ABM0QVQ1_GALVR|nr:PREDICTED: BTB/POZ domain-containing protein 9 [Galeopterus variegatus]